jgi:hypothetical protein
MQGLSEHSVLSKLAEDSHQDKVKSMLHTEASKALLGSIKPRSQSNEDKDSKEEAARLRSVITLKSKL